ncbi:MAG: [protein-PII] uridylyltransferase [Vicinamibacterales bacterium]
MKIDLGKITAPAGDRLGDPPPEGGQRVASFKRLLKLETDRLRMRHRFGLGGREITRCRSDLVDIVLGRVCQMAEEELGTPVQRRLASCAMVAVGGYGRRELAPCSDVDLLVLRPGRSSRELERFVERVLPMLWDVGLQIGHSFRSVAECVAIAREDLHSRNAMSDARLVTGSIEVFHRLQGELGAAVYHNARATRSFLRVVRAELQERLSRYGETVCLQEPNVKEGVGGLRDVHTVRWIAHALLGCGDVDRLSELRHIAASEHARVRRAYDFISRARNEIHFQAGRKTDVLTLELQPGIAEALGYGPTGGLEPSELFMRDYYRSAHELRHFNERFLLRTIPDPPEPLLAFRRGSRSVGPGGRYEVRGGKLSLKATASEDDERAEHLLEIFELVQELGVPMSDSLKHAVRDHLRLVDRAFRDSPDVATRFLAMLGRPGRVGPVLRAMHDTGFLERYLPAFRRISLLVQHDHYHHYTVDEHTIRAVEAVDALVAAREGGDARAPGRRGSPPDLLATALMEVLDVRLLVLGILLHDVGKGGGGGHAGRGAGIARRLCERLGLDAAATSDVVFLIQKHLVMSQVSQRRDLSDPELLAGFAETASTPDRLNMLFVLTYADTSAVGPGVWNDWKAWLLSQLYLRAHAALAPRTLPPSESARSVRLEEKVLAGLTPEYLRSDVEAFIAAFPDRYLRAVPPDAIARHFRMVHALGSRSLLTDWVATDHGRHTVLSACLPDAPGVLARLAGTLTGAGFDILAVDAFTRTDGIVLDVFTLAEADGSAAGDEARWSAVGADLTAALEGRHAVEAAVARRWAQLPWGRKRRAPTPPRVRLEPPDSLGRTVVEVRADNEPGLAYRIANCLNQIGLDISFAKIAKEKNQALDVFYVTTASGAPVSPEEAPRVEAQLIEALTSGWPPTA